MTNNRQRPFDVDITLYPFEDHWFEYQDGLMHYVDEGKGVPVVMLHGNPTWSFLYRKVIMGLDGICRSIAPDYPGFGFSDHPQGYGYTPAEHAKATKQLLDSLDLDPFILVIQDWGGPIGLSIAVDQPEKIAGIVLLNTWCWPPYLNARIFSWIMGGPVGKFAHLYFNFFAKVVLPSGILNPESKTRDILKAYQDAFPSPRKRMGTYVFPHQIRKSAIWLDDIENRLSVLQNKPVKMVWAKKDPAFGPEYYIRKWHQYFPNAPVERLMDASHFIQEDRPDRVIAAIKHVMDQIQ